MTFNQAILAMKLGLKITRKGWKRHLYIYAYKYENGEHRVKSESNHNEYSTLFKTCTEVTDWEIYHEPETTNSDAETGSKT